MAAQWQWCNQTHTWLYQSDRAGFSATLSANDTDCRVVVVDGDREDHYRFGGDVQQSMSAASELFRKLSPT